MKFRENNIEMKQQPKDISREFLELTSFRFNRFLETMKNEPALRIIVSGVDVDANNDISSSLKGFLEDPSRPRSQKRIAIIRETEEEHKRHIQNGWIGNAFASAVKWEKI
jgi:hypothetical protein